MSLHSPLEDLGLPACLFNHVFVLCRDLLGSNSSGLGHNNPRQKIQYHLKLKQELEELRHECTLLLRERFSLEQCVR